MSTPVSTPYTQGPGPSCYIKIISNGGTYYIHESYNGADLFQPYTFQVTGTQALTLVLPDPTIYNFGIGTEFKFRNNSTQSIVIQAPDLTPLTTLLSGGTQNIVTVGLTAGASSFSALAALSGLTSISNGGTGQTTAGTSGQLLTSNGSTAMTWTSASATPTANAVAKYSAADMLSGDGSFLGSTNQVAVSTGFTASATGTGGLLSMPEYLVCIGSSPLTITLPTWTTVQNGRSCTVSCKTLATATVNDNTGGLLGIVYPGQALKFYMTSNGAGLYTDAWSVSNNGSVLSPDPAVKVACSSRTVSFTTNSTSVMDASWPTEILTNTTVIVAGHIRLPPAASLPQGQSYHFTWTNNGGAGSVNIDNSAGTNLVQIGAAFSYSATCTLSNGTWVGLYGTNISVAAT